MKKTVRQSNFELLRIIAMLMVMVCHALGYVQEKDLVGITGISKLAVSQFCLICVNVFVMISGWFGIKASWKGAASLLFQVVFLTALCFLAFWAMGLPVSFKKDLLPYLAFGYGYWFVISYLILYGLAPVLNAFIEMVSEKEYRFVLYFYFTAEFIYGFLLDKGHFDYGFSALSFIGLYLLARYARLYPGRLFSFGKWTDLLIYTGVSILSMILFWFGYKWFGMGFHLNHYNSPLAIIAALYFLLFFSKLKIQSNTINWLAVSAFAIYLIHTNSLFYPYFNKHIAYIGESFPHWVSIGMIAFYLLAFGFVCILVDKLRIASWHAIINIKKKADE